MKPSRILPLLLAAFLGSFAHAATAATTAAKPNIVLLFIDDMGYGDIGPFGSTKNRTPHLDRMAHEGMKLTSFYAAPVCSVSRSQVMTGCYGQRVSIPGVFFPGEKHGINSAEHTVAELMRAQGYATMCIGKWHLGDQPEFLPTRHGFDHYFGFPYSNDMSRKSLESGVSVMPLVRDERVIELLTGDDQDRITERYTDEALKFIRENRTRPFFLYLPHTAVHTPIHPGGNFRGKSANGRFGDWVEEVDASVGRVLDTLRELKLEANTLVIFSSDNGPWLIKGVDGGTAGPLRGGKGSTWEGGMREPTIAWWPGRIAAGSVCDAVAGNIDFLPTFVALAGGKVPADRKIDGRDFSPLLLGKSKVSAREAHYYYRGYKLEAVRVGPWKLALGPQVEGTGKDAKKFRDATQSGLRLYNLDDEIGERTNVAAQHTDVVQRLQALAQKMAADLGDGAPGPGVRPAGLVEHPKVLFPSEAPPRAKKAQSKASKLSLPTFGALLLSCATACAAPAPDGTLRLHPDNPHYFQWRGKPAVLITSGEHYGAVINPDFDYTRYLNHLQQYGFNLTRVFGAYAETWGGGWNTLNPAAGHYLLPWARSATPGFADGGNKFDLSRFDDAYWNRLTAVVQAASDRGIVVEFSLFCQIYGGGEWSMQAYSPGNNINGIGGGGAGDVWNTGNTAVMAIEDAYVRKAVQVLNRFDNVYFELCNEPGNSRAAWHAHVAQVITSAEAKLPNRHLIQENTGSASPGVSLISIHYANPNALRDLYGKNLALSFGENGFRGKGADPYRQEAWDFMLAGGAAYNGLDWCYEVGHEDGSGTRAGINSARDPALWPQLKALKDFMDALDFVKMAPDTAVIKGGVPAGATARALVEPGKQYAVFLRGGKQADLVLDLAAGTYKAEWVNTKTGAVAKSETFTHAGGRKTLASPSYDDIALRVLAGK